MLALFICISYTCLVLKTAPYQEDSDDVISFVTEVQLTITMFCGYSMIMDTNEIKAFDHSSMDIVIVVINCCGFVTLVICNIYEKQNEIVNVAETIQKKSKRLSLMGSQLSIDLSKLKDGGEKKKSDEVSNRIPAKKIVNSKNNGESRIQITPLSLKHDFSF